MPIVWTSSILKVFIKTLPYVISYFSKQRDCKRTRLLYKKVLSTYFLFKKDCYLNTKNVYV